MRAYTTLAAAFVACTAAATMGQAIAGTTGHQAAVHVQAASAGGPLVTAEGQLSRAEGQLTTAEGRLASIEGHAAAVSSQEQARVRRYWTAWRMEHALPLRAAAAGHPKSKGARRTWMRAAVTAGRPKAARPAARHSAATKHAAPAQHSAAGASKPGATKPGATKPATAGPASPAGGWLSVSPQDAQRAPLTPALAASTAVARWDGGGAVANTTGKVFFSMGSDDYVCSGSTVASANSDVVVTAAHCVKNGTGTWATNWTFVPGYSNGNAPYGSYTARQFFISAPWSSQANNDYDVAFVTVNQASVGGASVPVDQEVGGQGIKFGTRPKVTTVFGYPSDPPYNGQQLFYCSGATKPDPYHATSDAGVRCEMTAGSSGGPWLDGFDWATGTGTITSVSSFKYSNNNQLLYGPMLGSAAQALYQAAEHS
jgi:V8-like Glu-specific endopeptidase